MFTDPLHKKSYDAVSAANPFAIDPAKITVEPGVSYLPSPSSFTTMPPVWSPTPSTENCSARRT